MIHDHKFYEMQCALAATGHLSEAEVAELEQHVSHCVSCLSCMLDTVAISREVFLAQDRPTKIDIPGGMQKRFVQRAIAAGIPLRIKSAPRHGINMRLVRVGAVSAVLLLLISFSWKLASTSRAERLAAQHHSQEEPITQPFAKTVASNLPANTTTHATAGSERRSKRKAYTRHRVLLLESPDVSSENSSHLHLSLNRSLFANEGAPTSFSDGSPFWSQRLVEIYVEAGAHNAGRLSFLNPYALNASTWSRNAPEDERSFHLNLALASLSRSESSLNSETTVPVPRLTFSAPAFHLDSSKSW